MTATVFLHSVQEFSVMSLQSGTNVLSLANQNPQNVLSLLRWLRRLSSPPAYTPDLLIRLKSDRIHPLK